MSTRNKQNRTEAQIMASRTNGSKSKGPTTAEGKQIVVSNRMVHGFRSQSVNLHNENPAD